MDIKDVIHLLRLQRHDLMNDLQIVHGYLSMGKNDKVKNKINKIIEEFNRERLLMNINCPNFALWLIQVNLQHNHIQFTYDIHTKSKNLHSYDSVLTKIGKTITRYILDDKLEIIKGELLLLENESILNMVITLSGRPIDWNRWKERLSEEFENVLIQVEDLEESIKFSFSISSFE
ncbi:Spo0B domain-containing protein [Ornithinibacillus sp. 179-J 7C1 HS]|uniref:Spo0B domain-containing protein n=1 Tax=Ornithinibacillus sp. 179-J 7C1 HS TaxID=3142384 RepID=UPI0039A105EE